MATPFFYYASRSYEGYAPAISTFPTVAAPSSTPSSTPSPAPVDPTVYDPKTPIYPLPPVKTDAKGNPTNPSDIDALKKAIRSNFSDLPQTCQQPVNLTADDIFTTADKIATQTGGDQTCTKDQYNKASQNSTSLSAGGSIDSFLATMKVAMDAQHSESQQEQKSSESGCGSLLINATNILNKQSQMQCVINNVSQSTSSSLTQTQNVSIQTTPLTAQEASDLAKLQQANAANLKEMTSKFDDDYIKLATVLGSTLGVSNPTSYQAAMTALADHQEKVLALIKDANHAAEDMYSRNLDIEDTTISLSSSGEMKTSVQLSTAAQQTLSSLATSVSKDVTAQAIANTFGTSVLDPSVKQAANSATQNNASSAASSISNITNNTSLSVDQSGVIKITCPGKLSIKHAKIDMNFVGSVITSAVLNQAITNGMSAASNFLSEKSNSQSVANKVAGLDDLQNALNAGITGAINAGNAPVNAALSGGSTTAIVGAVVAIVFLILAYKFFGGSGGGGVGGPNIQIVQK